MVLGTVIHEIGHVVGFYHEHSRYDRDEYVQVLLQNVRSPSLRSAFDKLEGDTLGYGYDYASVMHYGESTFAIQGTKTLVSKKPPNAPIGGQELSPLDICKINELYKCGE